MGRPPCCDKVGVKKGPWTPEEDIILVSYIQEHGPGNWRAVPTNTGLLRCSKSCRLRWTNYLRPGIRRGNFSDQEEKMIIHLQALLGNRWAAIASYLPQRTDNDIKNYWNTHLRKKLKKLQSGTGGDDETNEGRKSRSNHEISLSKGQWERRLQTDIHTAKQALCDALSIDNNPTKFVAPLLSDSSNTAVCAPSLSPTATFNQSTTTTTTTSSSSSSGALYASSTENISKLLQNWMKKTPSAAKSESSDQTDQFSVLTNKLQGGGPTSRSSSSTDDSPSATTRTNVSGLQFDSIFKYHQSSSLFTNDADYKPEVVLELGESREEEQTEMPLTLLEKWLFDDVNAPSQGLMDISSLDDASVFF